MARPVLLVSHLARPGEMTGAEQSLLDLARGLRGRGHELIWLTPGEGASALGAAALGCRVEVASWPRLFLASWQASLAGSGGRLLRFAAGAPRLLALAARMRRLGPGAALVNTLVNAGAVWSARRAGLPVLWRAAEIPGPGARRRLYQHLWAGAGAERVAVSRAVADALGGAATAVIPTGVEVPDPGAIARARAELRARLGLADDSVLVGHVGQFRPHKGQLEFVTAILGIPRAGATAVVLGSERDDPAYAARVRRAAAPLGNALRFPGYVAGSGTAVQALDVLAFTSTAPDPFPRVLLEAMAAGVAVAAFGGGGVDEALVPGAGIQVTAGDSAALGQVIAALLHDPALRARLGAAARARVVEQFSFARCVAAYGDRIEQVTRND